MGESHYELLSQDLLQLAHLGVHSHRDVPDDLRKKFRKQKVGYRSDVTRYSRCAIGDVTILLGAILLSVTSRPPTRNKPPRNSLNYLNNQGIDLIKDMDRFFSLLRSGVPEIWQAAYDSAKSVALDQTPTNPHTKESIGGALKDTIYHQTT